ncbi:MAG TPA: DUF3043 domain-containing protein [Candidatus Agrococcus pullicola]|uniref:DUF3043 domain-containing protein n=1 Tax=Candidatus Agrococcus pullicola TaxID=2838429 RepID=A0A9D2C8X5_9MICO|nr:DUF3043 domain-containing protein [Candidatus Agrococcus pullicola]
MPLFGSKPKNAADDYEAEAPTTPEKPKTPKRSELVKNSQRPLVPSDRKQAKKQAREQMAQQRQRAQEGYARGEEQYMPARDRGPVKRYARDYVDARFSIGSMLMPAMIIVLAMTFINTAEMRVLTFALLWAFVGLTILDCIVFTWRLRRKITQKFGPGKTKGVSWYASMRSTQMRFMRMPKPQVGRFQKID